MQTKNPFYFFFYAEVCLNYVKVYNNVHRVNLESLHLTCGPTPVAPHGLYILYMQVFYIFGHLLISCRFGFVNHFNS